MDGRKLRACNPPTPPKPKRQHQQALVGLATGHIGWQSRLGAAGLCWRVAEMLRRWPDDYGTQLSGSFACVYGYIHVFLVWGGKGRVHPPAQTQPIPPTHIHTPLPSKHTSTKPTKPGLYALNALLSKHDDNLQRVLDAGAPAILVRMMRVFWRDLEVLDGAVTAIYVCVRGRGWGELCCVFIHVGV